MTAPDGRARDEQPAVSHTVPYVEWRNGDKTHCCGVPVTDLPKSDYCVPRGDHEPGTTRCRGDVR